MIGIPGKKRLLEVASIFFIAVLPLLVYLKHAGYRLWAPEILILGGVVLAFSMVGGLLVKFGKVPAHAAILTALSLVVIDVQTDWFTTVGLRLLLCTVSLGGLFWLLRRRLSQVVVVGVGLVVLVTAVLPGEQRTTQTGAPAPRAQDNPALPFVLHLILDAHAGVEGIPAEFDPTGEAAARLKDFYLENSFALYGRAYSRYYNTRESLPNLLNFTGKDEPGFWLGEKFHRGMLLKQNKWFDLLHDRGYRIHVMESNYLRYFAGDKTGGNPHGDTLLSYTTTTIKPLENAPITAWQKIPFILSTYCDLSWMLTGAGNKYTELMFSPWGRYLPLPQWDLMGAYPGPLVTLAALDTFTEQLRDAGPGQAFFAHVMMPHSPFGLNADCEMELRPSHWYYSHDKTLVPQLNTPESRALRYPRYLEQMVCLQAHLQEMFQVLRDKGLWDDAIVIVHGDHGSRICLWEPTVEMKEKLIPDDYMDCYSTLFAVKGPGITPGYSRLRLPLDRLFTGLVRDGVEPVGPTPDAPPFVHFMNGNEQMHKEALPEFVHGRISAGASAP